MKPALKFPMKAPSSVVGLLV